VGAIVHLLWFSDMFLATPMVIKREVAYRNMEDQENGAWRTLFTVNPDGKYEQFEIMAEDFQEVFPEDPYTMRKKGYSTEVNLLVYPRVFGGIGRTELVSTEKIEKPLVVLR
jgi:hypothetical protein